MVYIYMSTWSNGDQKVAWRQGERVAYALSYQAPGRGQEMCDLWNDVRQTLRETVTYAAHRGPQSHQGASDFRGEYEGLIPDEIWEEMKVGAEVWDASSSFWPDEQQEAPALPAALEAIAASAIQALQNIRFD